MPREHFDFNATRSARESIVRVGVMKPHRTRPSDLNRREIHRSQRSHVEVLLIRKLCFQRLVREISQKYIPDVRYQASAIYALQAGAESYLVDLFQEANLIALHAHREFIMQKDMQLARQLHGSR